MRIEIIEHHKGQTRVCSERLRLTGHTTLPRGAPAGSAPPAQSPCQWQRVTPSTCLSLHTSCPEQPHWPRRKNSHPHFSLCLGLYQFCESLSIPELKRKRFFFLLNEWSSEISACVVTHVPSRMPPFLLLRPRREEKEEPQTKTNNPDRE